MKNSEFNFTSCYDYQISQIKVLIDGMDRDCLLNKNNTIAWYVCKLDNKKNVYVKLKILKDTTYVTLLPRQKSINSEELNKGQIDRIKINIDLNKLQTYIDCFQILEITDENNHKYYYVYDYYGKNPRKKYTVGDIIRPDNPHNFSGIYVFKYKDQCKLFIEKNK